MKKFTEKCAVDVSGWDELTYGKVMLDTVKRVGGHGYDVGHGDIDDEYNQLVAIGGSYNLTTIDYVKFSGLKYLTPTDILGEPLVKAIENGYTPFLKGDRSPTGIVDIVLADFTVTCRVESSCCEWGKIADGLEIIAYKLSQPSIKSKILAEKVSYDLKPIEGETINNDNFNSAMKAIHRIKELHKECGLTVNQMKAFDDILFYLND